jgi:hypothetical protein
LAGERVNDQNPLRSVRCVRQDFGMIRLESSGSDCSMGMSFRGKGVNPSYTPVTIIVETSISNAVFILQVVILSFIAKRVS